MCLVDPMPTANGPLQALGGRGAKEFSNFWSGTREYLWDSSHGITRLGLIVSETASGELLFLVFSVSKVLVMYCLQLQRLREPRAGEVCVFFLSDVFLYLNRLSEPDAGGCRTNFQKRKKRK